MMIVVFIVAGIVAIYFLIWIFSGGGKKDSYGRDEFTARLGRSVGGASHAVPGLTTARGQAPAHLMPGPAPDEIGPEENHIYVMPPDTSQDSADSSKAESSGISRTQTSAATTGEPSKPTTRRVPPGRPKRAKRAKKDAD